jgi:hypothetical protein
MWPPRLALAAPRSRGSVAASRHRVSYRALARGAAPPPTATQSAGSQHRNETLIPERGALSFDRLAKRFAAI